MERPLTKAERDARDTCARVGCVLTPEELRHVDDYEMCTRCYRWYATLELRANGELIDVHTAPVPVSFVGIAARADTDSRGRPL